MQIMKSRLSAAYCRSNLQYIAQNCGAVMTMLNRYGEHLNSVETLSFLEPSRQGFRACLSGERVERRLAAILAADVAGYSRLMGADEEAFNINDRWSNVLSRRLHDAYGNKVSVVNEGIGGNRVIPPVVANATAGPAAVDRLDRDVLGLSGVTHVIWLEGINDLGAGYGQAASATPLIENPVVHTPANIIAGYQNVVARLHANGI